MEEEENFNYQELNKRIKQAKNNPMYGISSEDMNDFAKAWYDSYKKLKKTDRRTIEQNSNYVEFMKLISEHPHVKSNVGYMVYIGDNIVSILGGEGAFCDEDTYEVCIIDKNNEFITHKYDVAVEGMLASLQYQTLEDIRNIFSWCRSFS